MWVGPQIEGSSRAEQHSRHHGGPGVSCFMALAEMPHLFSDIMDLTHLLSCNSDVEVGAHNEQLGPEETDFKNRETLFKRKGINFSTTTNEGRILRSSQVILAKDMHTAFCIQLFLRKRIEGNIRVIFNIGKVERTQGVVSE